MPACSETVTGEDDGRDFEVRADARSYRVAIATGSAEEHLRGLSGDAVVIADAFFRDRFADLPCPVLFVEAVEGNKTLDEAARLIEAARGRGLSRGGRIVAVGGGIVQDVACFVAATFMRGIAWSYLPTTVLGMVDSCIGGKASINVGRFKNIAGMIHPPDAILVDPDFALTLPAQHRAGGLCEAAKISFARGGDSFGRYMELAEAEGAGPEMAPAALAGVVETSLRAKRWFIEVDEFDRGERLLLNFGHTFGHAIEAATRFAVDHGAAVGLGMLCALRFARETGAASDDPRLERLEAHVLTLLAAVPGLAAAFATIDMAAFEAAVLSDKKHSPGSVTLVLPSNPEASPPGADGLPLALRRFPRDAATLRGIAATIPATAARLAA